MIRAIVRERISAIEREMSVRVIEQTRKLIERDIKRSSGKKRERKKDCEREKERLSVRELAKERERE